MWESLLDTDRQFFLWLNAMGDPAWDTFWLTLSDKWAAIPLYVLLLLVSMRQFGWKRTLVMLVAIALLITCTDQLTNFFKDGVRRLRPCHEPNLDGLVRLVKASCGGKYGYFSAHAANSAAVAAFFATLWAGKLQPWGWILVCWAFLVGYSRIYLGVHYPLDVLSGLFVGLLFGWIFARLYSLAVHKWMP